MGAESGTEAGVMDRISFEELLERDGKLVYSIRGVSMLPMLRQDRDLVVIRAVDREADRFSGQRLRPYDVAFYRRGENYVLHRVISVTGWGYLLRGDNTYSLEKVPEEHVLGVLTSFVRDGREYEVTDPRYLIYVRLWCASYGLRAAAVRGRGLLRRVLKRIFKR